MPSTSIKYDAFTRNVTIVFVLIADHRNLFLNLIRLQSTIGLQFKGSFCSSCVVLASRRDTVVRVQTKL